MGGSRLNASTRLQRQAEAVAYRRQLVASKSAIADGAGHLQALQIASQQTEQQLHASVAELTASGAAGEAAAAELRGDIARLSAELGARSGELSVLEAKIVEQAVLLEQRQVEASAFSLELVAGKAAAVGEASRLESFRAEVEQQVQPPQKLPR